MAQVFRAMTGLGQEEPDTHRTDSSIRQNALMLTKEARRIRDQQLQDAEKELAAALGELVIQFGRLETDVSDLAIYALDAKGKGSRDALTAVLSFRQKLDLIAALVDERVDNASDVGLVRSSVGRLADFEAQRNTFMHSFWGVSGLSDSHLTRFKPQTNRKKGLRRTSATADTGAIRRLARDINDFRGNTADDGKLFHLYQLLDPDHAV